MEVEIISQECIKPSSPTPLHLKTHKLSLLDQYAPPVYTAMVLYYSSQDTNLPPTEIISKRLQLLKLSLSKTLARFYPLAGKIKDSLSIDCDDNGIYFTEARVQSPLNEFLYQPDLVLINKFLPAEFGWSATPTPGTRVAMIQVTAFACGGIAIGILVSHLIADGASLSSFLKSWAAMARDTEEELCPKFDGSSLFPQNEAYPTEAKMMAAVTPFLRTGRWVTRRFLFDASAIAALKAKATGPSIQNPTRVEVVSALLCKHIMAASKAKYGFSTPTFVSHAVNLRRRAMPQFSEYCMGNYIWRATALFGNEEAEMEGLVFELRKAITKVNKDFVKSLQGDEGLFNLCKSMKDIDHEAYHGGVDFVGLSSWCNFGLYEIDYGWGKPTWVSCRGTTRTESVNMKIIVIIDSKLRDGIEAWVVLDEEDMAMLEVDKELLAYVTLDQSPMTCQ